ncbi:MAG: hypothetical protein IKQ39_04560 [Oscillospiraceae bacterium]|nr:hypothetical protein [Oscillospiraceae bacterium]
MFIPNTIPGTLAEMLAFLQPAAETGLFDTVEYHYDEATSEPDGIICTQNGIDLFRFGVNSSGQVRITPYFADGTEAPASRQFGLVKIDNIMRCAGGICFVSVSVSGSKTVFVIAKTSGGTTGSFLFLIPSNMSQSNFQQDCTIYPTSLHDNTSLRIFYSGYHIKTSFASDADRTILTKIPVAGAYGSTDCFTSAFIRTVAQFYDTGEQIIGGSHYGCMFHVALLDE